MTRRLTLLLAALAAALPLRVAAQETAPPEEGADTDAAGVSGAGADAAPEGDAAPAAESEAPPPAEPAGETAPATPADTTHELPPVVSRGSTTWRSRQSAFDVPRAVNVVDRATMRRGLEGVALDHLRFAPGIWLDHRTTSTADPVMRGLAGGNLLYAVDGNTISTLWGEGGFGSDDMYGKVDPFTVERLEVLRGAGSVPHGSNALGGVINLITRSAPHDFTDDGLVWGGASRGRYGSAADQYTARQEFWIAGPFYRVLAGATVRDINDVTGGRGKGVYTGSSAEDYNSDLAADFRLGERFDLRLTWQDVDRNHTHRFYRPTQDNFQDREALAVSATGYELASWWERVELSWYYQDKRDYRRFNENVKLANGVTLPAPRGEANTRTWQPRLEFESAFDALGPQRVTYGVMGELSRGESPDDEEFTYHSQGSHYKASPDALWRYGAVYLQHEWTIEKTVSLLATARYDHLRFSTDPDGSVAIAPTVSPSALSIHSRQKAVTGGLGATYHVAEHHNVYAGASRGFRQYSPSLSVSQVGAGVRVPTGLLDPVYAYTWEVGYKTDADLIQGEASLYRTRFDGFSTDDVRGTFQGQSWFDFNGNGVRDSQEDVLLFQTHGWAYVHGVDAGARLALHEFLDTEDRWFLHGTFSWNVGRTSNRESTGIRQPMRFTQPAHGTLSARWESAGDTGPWVELIGEAVRKYDRIPNARRFGDPAYRKFPDEYHTNKQSPLIRADGRLPGFTVLHLRAGYDVSENVRLTAAVNNLTDRDVRRAHSRMSDPGIDFQFGVDVTY